MWSVGVILGSNLLGFSEEEVSEIEESILLTDMEAVRTQFNQAGAHFVINSIKELPDLIEKMDELLQQDIFPAQYTKR